MGSGYRYQTTTYFSAFLAARGRQEPCGRGPARPRAGGILEGNAQKGETDMAKYLIKASYTLEGAKGLLKEGGSSRRTAVKEMIEALGGKLECFYYAFGDSDAIVVLDLPDRVTAAAMSLAIGATGAVELSTTVLLTPEEIDAAVKKSVAYRPPGA